MNPAVRQLLLGGGRSYPQELPIVLMGDSITAQNGNVSAPLNRWYINGFFTWANALSGARFRVVRNSGIGGNTTTQMLARFASDVVAYAPQFVTILGGTNDTVGATATTISNLTAMYDAARAAGIYVFALTVPWRSDDANKVADAQVVNAAIVSYWGSNSGGEVIDAYAATLNQTSYLAADGIHPVAKGAHAIGQLLAPRLANFGAPSALFGRMEQSMWPRPGAPRLATENPLMLGTGGSTNATLTGVLPTNWLVAGSTTIPTVASKFKADYGEGIQLSGQATVAGQTLQINTRPLDAFDGGRIAVGDTYSLAAVLEIVSGGSNLSNCNIGGQTPQAFAAATESVLPDNAAKLWLTSPRFVRDAGTSNGPLLLQLTAAGTGAFVVRFSQVSLVRH